MSISHIVCCAFAEVTKAAALMFVQLRTANSSATPWTPLDDEKLFIGALTKARKISVRQSRKQSRQRISAALQALSSRSGRESNSVMDARILSNATEVAFSHANTMIDEKVEASFPLALQVVWNPVFKKARKALQVSRNDKTMAMKPRDKSDLALPKDTLSSNTNVESASPQKSVSSIAKKVCECFPALALDASFVSTLENLSTPEAFAEACCLMCRHMDVDSDDWKHLTALLMQYLPHIVCFHCNDRILNKLCKYDEWTVAPLFGSRFAQLWNCK